MPCYPPKQVYGLGTKIARGRNHLELSKLEGATVEKPFHPFPLQLRKQRLSRLRGELSRVLWCVVAETFT